MNSDKGKEKVVDTMNYYNNAPCNGGSSSSFLTSFPPGYRFRPNDEELILDYLRPKVNNEELPPNKMHDIDLYQPGGCESCDLEHLAARYEPHGQTTKCETTWYFFTPRDRKYPKGKRPNRAAGNGYWKASGIDRQIRLNGVKIGDKKTLVFYRGKCPGIKTTWIMHEYRINYDEKNAPKSEQTRDSQRIKLDDWVLCRILHKSEDDKTGKQEKSNKACKQKTDVPEDIKSITRNDMATEMHYNHSTGDSMVNIPFSPACNNVHERDITYAPSTSTTNSYHNDDLFNNYIYNANGGNYNNFGVDDLDMDFGNILPWNTDFELDKYESSMASASSWNNSDWFLRRNF